MEDIPSQGSTSGDEVRKKFNELREKLGEEKLKYSIDELVEIFDGLKEEGYIINGFLGSGTEGPVFSIISNGNQFAVKVISANDAPKIDKELKIMEKFKNQHYIHQYIRSFYSESKKYFFHLTEKLACDLEQIMLLMQDSKQKFSYNQLIAFAIQMTTALQVLEKEQVIHSDLKPANILYDQINKCFKISDYGFSKVILQKLQKSISATKNLTGYTPKYTAPEVWKQNNDYTCKIDIYSLGLILLELICGTELNMFQAMGLATGAANASNYLKSEDKQYDSLNKIVQSMLIIDRQSRLAPQDLLKELQSLQANEETKLHNQLEAIQVDKATLLTMKQICSSSLSQISIDIKDNTQQIKLNADTDQPFNKVIVNQQQLFQEVQQEQQIIKYQRTVQPFFKKHISLVFKDAIETVWQLIEVEEALSKYRNEVTTSLDVKMMISARDFSDLDKLGQTASRIASALEGCYQSIITLSLEFCDLYISFQGCVSLSVAIEKCSRNLLVVSLIFKNCRIGPDEIRYFSQSLEKCENMITLELQIHSSKYDKANKIGPTGASNLASSLKKFKSLTELTLILIFQEIEEKGLHSIGQALGNCEKLTSLKVTIGDKPPQGPTIFEQLFPSTATESTGYFSQKSILEFGSSLVRCPNLITLSVSCYTNKEGLTNAIIPRLPFFAKLMSLTLFFYNEECYKINIQTLCTNLKECSNLTSLCLKMDSWELKDFVILIIGLEESRIANLQLEFLYFDYFTYREYYPSEMQKKKQLQRLEQQQQQLSRLGKSLSQFPNLTNLHTFFIQPKNNLTQFISTLLSEHLANNKSITTLSLSVNSPDHEYSQLISSDAKLIGASFEKCKYLQTLNLHLQGNKIQSEGTLAISESLKKCTNLKALELTLIEDYCCSDQMHKHVYTKYMDSIEPTITKDLKQCKNLQELMVNIKSQLRGYDQKKIKLNVLTLFNFFL